MNAQGLRVHKLNNLVHALLLLGGMVGLLALLGWLISGGSGVLWMTVLGFLLLLFTPRISPALILRLYNARPLHPAEVPGLERTVATLAERAGLPQPPTLYYVPSRLMNAFSVGHRDDGAIAVSDGLLRGLAPRELVAVLAHEVAHVNNNDMWLMSLADSVSRLVGGFSFAGQLLFLVNLPLVLVSERALPWWPILLMIFAPTVSALLQLALSRNREFDADLDAAELTGDPMGLAQALTRMERQQESLWQRLLFPGHRNKQPSLLRTHPHSEERIERLKSLAPAREARERPALPQFIVPDDWSTTIRGPRRRWHGVWF